MAISGRPAYMQVGGEIGYQVTSSVAGNSVGWKEYGTRLDYRARSCWATAGMHIDVRSRVSEPDAANSIDGIPAIKTRERGNRRGTARRPDAGHRRFDRAARSRPRTTACPGSAKCLTWACPFATVSHSDQRSGADRACSRRRLSTAWSPARCPPACPARDAPSPPIGNCSSKVILKFPNAAQPTVRASTCHASGSSRGSLPAIEAGPSGRQNPQNPPAQNRGGREFTARRSPGFIGPIGYDVLK